MVSKLEGQNPKISLLALCKGVRGKEGGGAGGKLPIDTDGFAQVLYSPSQAMELDSHTVCVWTYPRLTLIDTHKRFHHRRFLDVKSPQAELSEGLVRGQCSDCP